MPAMQHMPPSNPDDTLPAVSPSTDAALHRAHTMLAFTDSMPGNHRSTVSDAWLDALITWADAAGISEVRQEPPAG